VISEGVFRENKSDTSSVSSDTPGDQDNMSVGSGGASPRAKKVNRMSSFMKKLDFTKEEVESSDNDNMSVGSAGESPRVQKMKKENRMSGLFKKTSSPDTDRKKLTENDRSMSSEEVTERKKSKRLSAILRKSSQVDLSVPSPSLEVTKSNSISDLDNRVTKLEKRRSFFN